jgi:hypothetical protein
MLELPCKELIRNSSTEPAVEARGAQIGRKDWQEVATADLGFY